MPGGNRSPHSVLSTPTPPATSASATFALAHNHSPTAAMPALSQHIHRRQRAPQSIANSNMDETPGIAPPLTPPIDRPDGGGGGGSICASKSKKVGAPSFAAVVSSPPPTARSSTSSIYSPQEHVHSSLVHFPNKNTSNNSDNNLSGSDVTASISTDAPQTIIVASEEHIRSPSGGSMTSSSRYHSPLASPAGSAGNNIAQSGHAKDASSASPTCSSIPGPANATAISTPSIFQERGGGAVMGNDADPEMDFTGHDSGESSDDVEIYLDTLGLHDSAARMHVQSASHALGEHNAGPASRTSPRLLSDSATQHSQGQVSVSVSAPADVQFGAQTLQTQQWQQHAPDLSPTTPDSTRPPSNANNSISTLDGNSNANFGALRVTGPEISQVQQSTTPTGVAGGVGKNALSPLPVPLSIPLSISPSNSAASVTLERSNPRSDLQPQQLSGYPEQQQHRPVTTPSQFRNHPRAPVYSTIPLPDVEDSHQGHHGSSEYDHGSAGPGSQQRQQQQLQQDLDLDRQHQHHLHLQQQQDQQQMHGHSTSVRASALGPAEIDISGLAGLSISGDARRAQQPFSLGITASQTLPSISTSGPFDFDTSPNIYSGPGATDLSRSNATSGLGFPTSASESTLLGGLASGASSASSNLGLGPKTPNVYINGLPPHFPEDQLFALASPFGEIRSVRTFTRHVRDSESGYGFVLFETIESAEKCILSLRRYRNLHPTFSKQIHKIPGTVYAQGAGGASTSSWDDHGGGDSGGSSPGGSGSSGPMSADASFKARMESLQDPTSTNLYMEGLPLSIDEPTLSALVSPHRIISSRFFQTRLSNPPRIIAFVRLENRLGAEEVIERLHGRMVRGWNDAGSRISVRFADTSEQRELRRQERTAQEGDGSPARLTIAQAALLNLRGQHLKSGNSGQTARLPSASGRGGGLATSLSTPDFASNAHVNLPPVIGSGGIHQGVGAGGRGGSGLEVDYSLAPGRSVVGSRSRSPYQLQSQGQYSLGHTPPASLPVSLPPASSTVDPSMSALLDSLRQTGVPFQPGNAYGDTSHAAADYDYNGMSSQRGIGLGHGHHQHQPYHQEQHIHASHHHLPTSQSLDSFSQPYSHSRVPPAYTRSGYTATEEYIMRAHAENTAMAQVQRHQQHESSAYNADRRRPAPLDLRRASNEDPHGQDYQDPVAGDGSAANIAVGVRAYRAQASIGRIGSLGARQGLMSPPSSGSSLGMLSSSTSMPSMSSLASMDPSASSASAGVSPLMGVTEEDYQDMSGNSVEQRQGSNAHQAHLHSRLAREHHVQRPPMPLSPSIGAPPANQDLSSNAPGDTIDYQHAAAHMRSTTLPQHRPRERGHYQQNSMSMPAQNLRTPQHAAVAALSGPRGIDGAPGPSGTIHENDSLDQHQHGSRDGGNGIAHPSVSPNHNPPGTNRSPMFGDLVDSSSSAHSPSPSLISPTLTYSSQTPSTLSPATPFFGSFNSQSEGFGDKNSPSNLDHHQHHHPQPKKQGSTGSAMTPSALRSFTSEGA